MSKDSSPFFLYAQEKPGKLPVFNPNKKLNDPSLYQPSKALSNAVNVALALGQPLLLTGEPGTGKTQLAYHIAWYFGLDKPEVFQAQTTSTATDLFYKYDALRHFQYNQNRANDPLSMKEVEEKFITYQGLGKAIRAKGRMVVLIDEIDKAPRDLPNDVLAAIEKLEFKVPEVNEAYETTPENRPIIIMTSNSEKNLPDAFLRRVVYYHIPFPDRDLLLSIIQQKIEGYSEQELSHVVDHFESIRTDRGLKLKKLPATAELIFWATVLQKLDFPVAQLKDIQKLDASNKEKLRTSYSVLAKTKDDLASLIEKIDGKRRR